MSDGKRSTRGISFGSFFSSIRRRRTSVDDTSASERVPEKKVEGQEAGPSSASEGAVLGGSKTKLPEKRAVQSKTTRGTRGLSFIKNLFNSIVGKDKKEKDEAEGITEEQENIEVRRSKHKDEGPKKAATDRNAARESMEATAKMSRTDGQTEAALSKSEGKPTVEDLSKHRELLKERLREGGERRNKEGKESVPTHVEQQPKLDKEKETPASRSDAAEEKSVPSPVQAKRTLKGGSRKNYGVVRFKPGVTFAPTPEKEAAEAVSKTAKAVSETVKAVPEATEAVSRDPEAVPETARAVPETAGAVPETAKAGPETPESVPKTGEAEESSASTSASDTAASQSLSTVPNKDQTELPKAVQGPAASAEQKQSTIESLEKIDTGDKGVRTRRNHVIIRFPRGISVRYLPQHKHPQKESVTPQGVCVVIGEKGATIGRGGDSTIQVQHNAVSTRHLRIEVEAVDGAQNDADGLKVFLTDLGSLNGTFLSGIPIHSPGRKVGQRKAANLKKGPVQIRLGDCPLKLDVEEADDETLSTPTSSTPVGSGGEQVLPKQATSSQAIRNNDVPATTRTRRESFGDIVAGFEVQIAEDVNRAGLRRAKKKAIQWDAKGKKKRESDIDMMEDSSVVVEFGPYLPTAAARNAVWSLVKNAVAVGVFDGHVGRNAAQKAKRVLPEIVRDVLTGTDVDAAVSSGSVDMTKVLEQVMALVAAELDEFEYEGATGTVTFMWQEGVEEGSLKHFVQSANVGDSLAFLYSPGSDGRGDIKARLSEEHRLVHKNERERIERETGQELPATQTRVGGLSVSRSLGDRFLREQKCGLIDKAFISSREELDVDDVVVIASDGLWDVLSGHAVGRQLYRESEVAEDNPDKKKKIQVLSAKRIMQTALQAPTATDNITVVIVKRS